VIAAMLLQLSFVTTVNVGDFSGLGFVAPLYGVGVSIEQRTERFEFSLSGDWSPDRKFSERILTPPFSPQFTLAGEAQGLVRFGPTLVGGGANVGYTKSDGWDKTGWRWHASGGVDLPIEAHNLRLLVTHVEPMSDPSNDLRGERYGLRFDVNGRHRIGFDVGVWRFHQSGNPAVHYERRTWVLHVGEAW